MSFFWETPFQRRDSVERSIPYLTAVWLILGASCDLKSAIASSIRSILVKLSHFEDFRFFVGWCARGGAVQEVARASKAASDSQQIAINHSFTFHTADTKSRGLIEIRHYLP